MENALQEFKFENNKIRTIVEEGKEWFVGKDVCRALGYINSNLTIKRYIKGVSKRYPLSTPGGFQQVCLIQEPDVLRLIINSKMPFAIKFEKWVFEVVLPTLRKTGSYSVNNENNLNYVKYLLAKNNEAILNGVSSIVDEKVQKLEENLKDAFSNKLDLVVADLKKMSKRTYTRTVVTNGGVRRIQFTDEQKAKLKVLCSNVRKWQNTHGGFYGTAFNIFFEVCKLHLNLNVHDLKRKWNPEGKSGYSLVHGFVLEDKLDEVLELSEKFLAGHVRVPVNN